MMCGQLPAILEGNFCNYGYDCAEGLDCFDYGCQTKDVQLTGACLVTAQCADGNECRNMICEVPLVILDGECAMTNECIEGLECRDLKCQVPLVALDGQCTMTSDCVEDLTCYEDTCKDIPQKQNGHACTTNIDCGNMSGLHVAGECRNNVCGPSQAVLEGGSCTYGFECEEGHDCFDNLCLEKDVPLGDPCELMDQCLVGLECRDMICQDPLPVPQTLDGACAIDSDC